ncbi:MAG: hypothetical protein V4668_01075 [Patescibacteria group bacterium]
MLKLQILQTISVQVIAVATATVLMVVMLFTLLEPTLGMAIDDTFIVRQQITDEISFLVPAADVTMVGPIAGITGGNATGTTYVVVRTNNAAGYTMDISFSTTTAMRGETSLSTAIRDYGTSTAAEPTFAFNASTSAQFAYSVTASTTADIDPSFLNNGSACNVGGASTVDTCFKGPATSTFRIINRTSDAGTGATTTIRFKVNVPSNPSPAVTEDFYTATATLTALNS